MRARPTRALSLLLLSSSGSALAGVPGPCGIDPPISFSGVEVLGQGAPCQFRFHPSGGYDQLLVLVTLRWCADPLAHCLATVAIEPSSGTGAFCSCCPTTQQHVTDEAGVLSALFTGRIGGRGRLDVSVTAHCVGDVLVSTQTFDFTSPDLDGSCQASPQSATNIIDLGIWAGCLPPEPYCRTSDFDCSGAVGVIDLGLWAGGLGQGCSPCS
jgi:hypothetical protein